MNDAPNCWLGWPWILGLHENAMEKDKVAGSTDRSLYFTTLFETGGRVSECLELRRSQIDWNDVMIRIDNMEVLKRRERFTRQVFIVREGNPLADAFLDHVEACEGKYLWPGFSGSFTREVDPEAHASSAHVYRKIVDIDPDIWPHLLRDQRSWQLSAKVERGGRGLDIYLLRKWFEWKSMAMPAYYAGRREESDLLDALGVVDLDIDAQLCQFLG